MRFLRFRLSDFVHNDAGGTHEAVGQPVAATKLAKDNAVGLCLIGFVTESLMELWVKGLPHGVDGLEAAGLEKIPQLSMDHGETVDDPFCSLGRLIALGSFKTKFEIIEDRQQFFEKSGISKTNGLLLLTDHALAIVLEIGGGSQRNITVALYFGLQIGSGVFGSTLRLGGRLASVLCFGIGIGVFFFQGAVLF